MSEKKPIPDVVQRVRAKCPVCGMTSYSAAGIHPQCELARADAISKAKFKAANDAEAKTERTPHTKRWSQM